MQENKFLILQENGFTLFELILASAAAGLVALLLISTIGIFEKESKKTRFLILKQVIIADIRSALSNKNSLHYNLQKETGGKKINLGLFNCLCGVGTCKTLKKPADAVSIYNSSGLLLSPQFYDDKGSHCTSPSNSNCIFSVSADLYPVCYPNFNLTKLAPKKDCNGETAEFVAIKYTIDSNIANNANSPFVKPAEGYVYIESASLGSGMCL